MAYALLTHMFLISCCRRGGNLKLKTYYKLQLCLFVVWSFAVFCWPRTPRLREPPYIQMQTRLINYLHASESGATSEINSNVFVSICCFNTSLPWGYSGSHDCGGRGGVGGCCLKLMPLLQNNYRFQISIHPSVKWHLSAHLVYEACGWHFQRSMKRVGSANGRTVLRCESSIHHCKELLCALTFYMPWRKQSSCCCCLWFILPRFSLGSSREAEESLCFVWMSVAGMERDCWAHWAMYSMLLWLW